MTTPTPHTLVRLTPEVYADLEKKFATFVPTTASTGIEAGYALGVQAVLKALRIGYVVTK